MANQKITTTALEFDEIKASLKEYLSGQAQYTDYNFDGSGLSLLLDVLAYNTHYNALYTNLAINEMFIDSASKRSSVVSKAKELGYIPRSASGALAVVNLTINAGSNTNQTYTIGKGTKFTTQVDGVPYVFNTTQAYTAVRTGSQFIFNNVVIKEGNELTYAYTVAEGEVYIIPNANVDLNTLTVRVQENSGSSSFDTYTRAESILNINAASYAYFIKETDEGLYEIEFGNGVVGRALDNGNYITISYMTCNGSLLNGANTFVFAGDVPSGGSSVVVTLSSASNGSFAEDIDSIRWAAPRAFASQNRCVTVDDYKTIIKNNFSNTKSVNVWGGETLSPPIFGKVFISVVPETNDLLTEDEKRYILEAIVGPRKILSIAAEIVDPEYLKIELNTTVYYNPQFTVKTSGDIETLTRLNIVNYNNTVLNDFNSILKFSKLNTIIDETDRAITGNITTVKLHKEIVPIYGVESSYTIRLGNPIYSSGVAEESILSGAFTAADTTQTCYIEDIPIDTIKGNLRLFYYNSTGQKIPVKNVGTVDYSTGTIYVTGLNIISHESEAFTFTIKPQSNDVASTQQQFAYVDETLLTVSAIVDLPTNNYKFTSSRS